MCGRGRTGCRQGTSLYTALQLQNGLVTGQTVDLRTACNPAADILCSAVTPAVNTGAVQGTDKLGNPQKYTYNDGDGSTAYDVEYPLQIHGFDPNFHFVGMTFNPEAFADMKDKFFLLNGRSYPDTVTAGPAGIPSLPMAACTTRSPCPPSSTFRRAAKRCCASRISTCTEYQTLASLGIPMKEVGFNAKLLRDQAGNNHGVLHELDHAGRRRVARCDCWMPVTPAAVHGLRGQAVSGGQHVLPLHTAARPSCPTTRRTSAG